MYWPVFPTVYMAENPEKQVFCLLFVLFICLFFLCQCADLLVAREDQYQFIETDI